MQTVLLQQLAAAESLARASKLRRWLAVPGKYTLAQTLRFLPGRHRYVRPCTTFFGQPMRVVLPASLDIYLTGAKTHDSELRLARYLVRTLRAGQTFVDVGAHFGYFSLLAAKLVGPGGRVDAVEAAPSTFAVLRENVASFSNVHLHHRAVYRTDGTRDFYEFPGAYSEYSSFDIEQYAGREWLAAHPPRRVTIGVQTLTTLLDGRRPCAIKIDVEGGEEAVIEGASAVLAASGPTVIMEYLSRTMGNGTHAGASERLRRLGYSAHGIRQDGTLAPLKNIDAHLEDRGFHSDNVVFLPA